MKLYIPNYNQAEILKRIKPPHGFDVTVVDNASTDDSVEQAHKRGWRVVTHPYTVERVTNWENCVKHFINSDGLWCKWLFTGDVLYPQAFDIFMRASAKHPNAKLMIAPYWIVDGTSKSLWKPFMQTTELMPEELMEQVAKRGNIFGAPLAQAFHRDAVIKEFNFGAGTWAADMQFCLNIGKQFPIVFLDEPVGEFHIQSRNTYKSNLNAFYTSIEEYQVAFDAASTYLSLTKSRKNYETLHQELLKRTEVAILNKAVAGNRLSLKQLIKGCLFKCFSFLKNRRFVSSLHS